MRWLFLRQQPCPPVVCIGKAQWCLRRHARSWCRDKRCSGTDGPADIKRRARDPKTVETALVGERGRQSKGSSMTAEQRQKGLVVLELDSGSCALVPKSQCSPSASHTKSYQSSNSREVDGEIWGRRLCVGPAVGLFPTLLA